MIRTNLTIMGKPWKVRKKKKLIHEEKECFGLMDPDTRTIWIKSGLTELQETRIYWHEYMHARLYEAGVIENTGGINNLAEEIICDSFADFMTYEITPRWNRMKR